VEIAYDAKTGRQLTISQFIELYGPKLDAKGQLRRRPPMICYACKGGTHTVAEAGPLRDALWGHDPDPTRWCPVKTDGGVKYELLEPVTSDEKAGKLLRASVLTNWRAHWGYVCTIAPMADIDGWIGFIRHADRTNFWSNKGIQECFIPYIFLATCDFPPPKNPKAAAKRDTWLRFRFTSRIRTLDDLWTRTTGDWELLQLEYRKPKTAQPTPADLFRLKSIAPDETCLNVPYTSPHPFQLRRMNEEFDV
jgi:hypothetical protein